MQDVYVCITCPLITKELVKGFSLGLHQRLECFFNSSFSAHAIQGRENENENENENSRLGFSKLVNF
jgi:hypothetical protein